MSRLLREVLVGALPAPWWGKLTLCDCKEADGQPHQSLCLKVVRGWRGSTAQATCLKELTAARKFGASSLEIASRVWGIVFGISSSMANLSLLGGFDFQ